MSYSANLEIQMPETAPLELRNRFGSVTVQKLRAPATINNGNGNVVLMQGSGRQRVEDFIRQRRSDHQRGRPDRGQRQRLCARQ